MVHRVLSICIAMVVLLVVGGCSQPTTDTHKGKVAKMEGNRLTMTDMRGQREQTHEVSNDAVVTCAGQSCVLNDIKPGFTITVTAEKRDEKMVVTKIEAEEAKS